MISVLPKEALLLSSECMMRNMFISISILFAASMFLVYVHLADFQMVCDNLNKFL